MMSRVAIVDDDQKFTELMSDYLSGRGYKMSAYNFYVDAQRRITERVKVVLIDVSLLDGNGIELLKELRHKFPLQKHIMLTGRDCLPVRLQSFAYGAEDYMKKPIFPSELEARIHRLLKANAMEEVVMKIDKKRYTKTEQIFLKILLDAKGELIPLDIFEKECSDSKMAVYTCLFRLKKKAEGQYLIKSAYGRGWYLEVI